MCVMPHWAKNAWDDFFPVGDGQWLHEGAPAEANSRGYQGCTNGNVRWGRRRELQPSPVSWMRQEQDQLSSGEGGAEEREAKCCKVFFSPQAQILCSDEPMTTFAYCHNCGNRWTVSWCPVAVLVMVHSAGRTLPFCLQYSNYTKRPWIVLHMT